MAQAAGQLTQDGQTLSADQGFLGRFKGAGLLFERLLRSSRLGQIAGHLGKSAQAAGAVAYRGDHHVGPEARAVLAKTPALVLAPALRGGDLEQVRGRPRPERLLGVEAGVVAAPDFLGAIALDPLGAGVPGHHPALGVEHEDGIVDHAVDEQPEAHPVVRQRLGPPRPRPLGHAPSSLRGLRRPSVRYTVGYQPIRRKRFPKLDVAGSNPVGRSTLNRGVPCNRSPALHSWMRLGCARRAATPLAAARSLRATSRDGPPRLPLRGHRRGVSST